MVNKDNKGPQEPTKESYTLRNKRNGKVVTVEAVSLWMAKDLGARETCASHQDLRYSSEIMILVTK